MVAAIDWSNLPIAAAFILGAVGGTIATIRITRSILDYLRHERDDRNGGTPTPSGDPS